MQYRDADGALHVVGSGRVTDLAPDGSVRRAWVAGLGIRALAEAPGVSLGWHETTYFVPPAPDAQPHPAAAVQLESYGLDVGDAFLVLGYHRTFAVAAPDPASSAIQVLHYSARNPGTSRAWKEVVP